MVRALTLAALMSVSTVAWAGSVKASSELSKSNGDKHPASAAFDGSLQTAWAEGEEGVGEGAWIEVRFDRPVDVSSVSLWPGDLRKGDRTIKENGRPRMVTVTLSTVDGEEVSQQVRVRDGATRGIQRVDVKIEGQARSMRLTVDEAYKGFLHNDMYIAEIAVNFASGDDSGPLSRLTSYTSSSSAEKAAAAHREKVIGLFDAIDQSDFGDRDALYTLFDYAANGAPWLSSRVMRDVPAGFRINGLPPDPVAVEALLKLKDGNSVSALQMAALRSKGKAARKLMSKASYLEAYTELQAGARRNLDTWGEAGWEKGALQSLGEPLGVELGVFGDIYIADTANNRISIFNQDGVSQGTWGVGEPEITKVWFSGKRNWYVTARPPSDKPGGFSNPVALDLIPGKDSEELLVLDAMGRVQWFMGDGTVKASWKVSHETGISPGVGGEGHVFHSKGKVVVVWGNEVVTFDEEGTELSRFETEEGVPQTAEMLRNGKIILGFAREGVMYSTDGYRHGTVISDELPRGFEAWDLASDEKGKLWIVTDNGWAVKLKKPGKVDFQVQWATWSVNVPRFTVYDGMLYIVASDKISRVDALDLKQKAEAGDDGPKTLDVEY